MAPKQFSMVFSAMLTNVFQNCDAGFSIMYRFDGKLFNLRRLQAKTKVQLYVFDKLLSADIAENTKTETNMQEATNRVLQAC